MSRGSGHRQPWRPSASATVTQLNGLFVVSLAVFRWPIRALITSPPVRHPNPSRLGHRPEHCDHHAGPSLLALVSPVPRRRWQRQHGRSGTGFKCRQFLFREHQRPLQKRFSGAEHYLGRKLHSLQHVGAVTWLNDTDAQAGEARQPFDHPTALLRDHPTCRLAKAGASTDFAGPTCCSALGWSTAPTYQMKTLWGPG